MSRPLRDRNRPDFDYQRYLASREWAVLKRLVHERAEGICERCRIETIAATHHLTYERVGHEDVADLLGVCSGCHDFLSAASDIDPIVETLLLVGGDGESAHRLAAAWQALSPQPIRFSDWDLDDMLAALRD